MNFFRLGSTKNTKTDTRIIAATNKNLLDEIKQGNFRKDLFYRLNISSVYLPPLKDRKGDINLLSQYFLRKFNSLNGKKIEKISEPVLELLNSYGFPGNIRELMNIINSAVIIENTKELKKKSLPHYFLDNTVSKANHRIDDIMIDKNLKSLKEVEKDHIRRVMKYTKGNKTKASKILGISRVNLIKKVKDYEID